MTGKAPGLPRSTTASIQRFMRSIRFRLTLWTLAVLGVILVAFTIFIYTRQAYDLQLEGRNLLQARSQQVQSVFRAARLFTDDENKNSIDFSYQAKMLYEGDKEVLGLVAPSGQSLVNSGTIDDQTILELINSWQSTASPNETYYRINNWQAAKNEKATDYLFLITPIFLQRNMTGALIIGRPLDPSGQLPRLGVTLLLGSLATLLVALGGGYWLASRAMAPVRTITRAARNISETDLHHRLNLGRQDELGDLANTFDGMLARLQAAFDRQRQFTADASHELRTPLTIMGLEADQALTRRRSPEEYERALTVIKSENEFMARLVNDMLTLARMDAGQTQLRLEALDLSEIALDVVERVSMLTRRGGVEMQLGDGLPEVQIHGDRQYLTQLLTNLVENAVKYAGGRGKHVRIETGLEDRAGRPFGWARVEDDGPGIPPEHLPRLFDRFYRVDQSRSRDEETYAQSEGEKAPGGSGLGLSIVQWIARAHGGEVTVQSTVGVGTAFILHLPIAAGDPPRQ
jgi:heavy metal sensor kinase